MPLIYSGQEYDMTHRLKFFEKDSIPKEKGKTWELLTKLGSLKNNQISLNGGKEAASYKKIDLGNENVLCFEREKNGETIIFLANMSDKDQSIAKGISGNFKDLMAGDNVTIDKNYSKMNLKPWEFELFLKK